MVDFRDGNFVKYIQKKYLHELLPLQDDKMFEGAVDRGACGFVALCPGGRPDGVLLRPDAADI